LPEKLKAMRGGRGWHTIVKEEFDSGSAGWFQSSIRFNLEEESNKKDVRPQSSNHHHIGVSVAKPHTGAVAYGI
jgi:hypothetical protein